MLHQLRSEVCDPLDCFHRCPRLFCPEPVIYNVSVRAEFPCRHYTLMAEGQGDGDLYSRAIVPANMAQVLLARSFRW